jgi:FkbM family methyltransferase
MDLKAELSHLEAALRYVRRWGVAVDGGANVGDWTARMAEQFDRVHAFEPAADTFFELSRRFESDPRVRLWLAALWDAPGFVSVCEPPKRAGKSRSRFVQRSAVGVRAVTLDEMDLHGVGLVKLDLEGAEFMALRGAEQTLRRERPVVIMEVDKLPERRHGVPNDAAPRFLESLGARFVERHGIDDIYIFD